MSGTGPKKEYGRGGMIMPGEFEEHEATVMIWPVREGSFPNGAREAQETFAEIAGLIARGEKVYLLSDMKTAKPPEIPGVTVLDLETDDAWARDVCPTFVRLSDGTVAGVDWRFNAWGGEYDGLYRDYERDDACAARLCGLLSYPVISARPFVLEGGSIHSDGRGTVMTTEECLLSKGRNPELGREEIEERLKAFLGAERVIWLPAGICGDETNGHIDNFCAFIRPGEAVLAWTDDEADPQHERCEAALQILREEHIKVTRLPLPRNPVCIREEELSGFRYEEGEEERYAGEKLAASYVNFYIANSCVLVPRFEDPMDEEAVRILSGCFPDRKVIPVRSRSVLLGGGNIHCITQQIPKSKI